MDEYHPRLNEDSVGPITRRKMTAEAAQAFIAISASTPIKPETAAWLQKQIKTTHRTLPQVIDDLVGRVAVL